MQDLRGEFRQFGQQRRDALQHGPALEEGLFGSRVELIPRAVGCALGDDGQ